MTKNHVAGSVANQSASVPQQAGGNGVVSTKASIVLRLREFVHSISSEGYPTSDKRIAAVMDDAAAKIERMEAALAECESLLRRPCRCR